MTKGAFTSKDVIFDEHKMLQEKSKAEDKTHSGAPNTSADSHIKKVKFLEDSKMHNGSNKDSSNLGGGDEQGAT